MLRTQLPLSPLFIVKAEEKFSAYPFLRAQLLDIEKDPQGQGFAPASFDIIIAANVLHATADLRHTLAHIQQLLAPAGMLVLLEGTQPQRWVDLTFGLTEGWWKFSDTTLRPAYPLLSTQGWVNLLTSTGFTEAVSIPALEENSVLSGQAVLLARGSQVKTSVAQSESPAHWLIFADGSGVGSALAESLSQRGHLPLMVSPADQYGLIAQNHWQINPASREDFRRLWREALKGQPCRGVVYLWSLELPDDFEEVAGADLQGVQVLNSGSVTFLTQTILSREKQGCRRCGWRRAARKIRRPPISPNRRYGVWGGSSRWNTPNYGVA